MEGSQRVSCSKRSVSENDRAGAPSAGAAGRSAIRSAWPEGRSQYTFSRVYSPVMASPWKAMRLRGPN